MRAKLKTLALIDTEVQAQNILVPHWIMVSVSYSIGPSKNKQIFLGKRGHHAESPQFFSIQPKLTNIADDRTKWLNTKERKKKQTIDVGVISMDFKITMINLLKKQVTGFHALIKIS